LNASGATSVTVSEIDNGSNDACGIASVSLSPAQFDCSNAGANTVTLTVTDNNTNVSTCTATVPVQLKNWIDAIARNGVSVRYTDQGPEGLLKGKSVYVALARGGSYRGTDADSQVPYLKTVLGFLGMTDVHFIYAEGLNMGEEAAARGFAQAEIDLTAAFAAA
jgi:hypothetical protein